jgi:hypothetical protein
MTVELTAGEKESKWAGAMVENLVVLWVFLRVEQLVEKKAVWKAL